MKEIATIMGVDEIDTNNPEWFKHRLAASKNIIDEMSDSMKEGLRKKGEEMAEKGFPEDVQRRYVSGCFFRKMPVEAG